MQKRIMGKLASVRRGIRESFAILRQSSRALFYSQTLQGEGMVFDCRLKEPARFGIFSPQAMAFCDKVPDEEVVFLVTVEFQGKRHVVKKREFFCIGKKVKVTYCKCFCGIRIENIEQIRYFLYH